MVFDDSFTHEAWNASDRCRAVLIIDLWHPDLSDWEIEVLEEMHRYYATAEESNTHRGNMRRGRFRLVDIQERVGWRRVADAQER